MGEGPVPGRLGMAQLSAPQPAAGEDPGRVQGGSASALPLRNPPMDTQLPARKGLMIAWGISQCLHTCVHTCAHVSQLWAEAPGEGEVPRLQSWGEGAAVAIAQVDAGRDGAGGKWG